MSTQKPAGARRIVGTLAGLALAATVSCAGLSAGRRVEIDGTRLYLLQKGEGGPTVLFDSGLGDSLAAWRWVWPEVATFTSVVLYDRAGLGRSEPGRLPRTSGRIVNELHAALAAAGTKPPYVLVGHSLGGLNLRLFAATYPDQAAGLILVDATPVDYPGRDRQMRSAAESARVDTMLALGPPGAREEYDASRTSAEQVRRAGPPPGIPIVVLSSTRPEEGPEFRTVWAAMQEAMAAELGAEEHWVTGASGHYIQYDEPERVVEAIRTMVRGIRERRRGAPRNRGSGAPVNRRAPARSFPRSTPATPP